MEAAIFYVCFVLFVVCVLAAGFMMYAGSKVCEKSGRIGDAIEYVVFRILLVVLAISLAGVYFTWPGGA